MKTLLYPAGAKFITQHPTKFLPKRSGVALSGGFVPVPVGTEITLVNHVPTERGRALFTATLFEGVTVWGYENVEFLTPLKG